MGLSQGLCLGNKQVNKRTSWSRLAWRLWVCTQLRTALDLFQEALSQMTTTTFLCSRRASVSRCGRKARVSAEFGWPEVKDSATCCVSCQTAPEQSSALYSSLGGMASSTPLSWRSCATQP